MKNPSISRTFTGLIGYLVLGSVLAFAAAAAFGQGTSGSIAGTVADSSGAVIPGATVTLSNTVSGYTRTVKADSAGQFRFSISLSTGMG